MFLMHPFLHKNRFGSLEIVYWQCWGQEFESPDHGKKSITRKKPVVRSGQRAFYL